MSNNVIVVNPGIVGPSYNSGSSDNNWFKPADKEVVDAIRDSIQYKFKILALGVVKGFENNERNINFKQLDIQDDNSMVKVNNVKLDCYYNNKLIPVKDNIIKRDDYNSNILLLNKNINLSNIGNSKYYIKHLSLDNDQYTVIGDVNIQKSYGSGTFSYTITPNNTDFEIDLSKHKISKTFNLSKSKDSLFGEYKYQQLDDTYDQKYTNCETIKSLVNNCSDLIEKEFYPEIDFGIENFSQSSPQYIGGDYRKILKIENTGAGTKEYNAYYYSNIHTENNTPRSGNPFEIKLKNKLIRENFIKYPEGNSDYHKFILNNLQIDSCKLEIDPINYRILLDGHKQFSDFTPPSTYKETETFNISSKYYLEDGDRYERKHLLPPNMISLPEHNNPYYFKGFDEQVIDKGTLNVEFNKDPELLLHGYSQLEDKATRDDVRFAFAFKDAEKFKVKAKPNNYKFIVKNDLINDKQSIGSFKYSKITDYNTGISVYQQYDSDDKVVLKLPSQQTFNGVITNSFEWLNIEGLDEYEDKYHTFNNDNIKYYNIKEKTSFSFSPGANKIIAFYIKKEDVNKFQFIGLIQPKLYNETEIDDNKRDIIEIAAEGYTQYHDCRVNQIKYLRVVLLSQTDSEVGLEFTENITIYNPIIYNATINTKVIPVETNEESSDSTENTVSDTETINVCYDFRAPQLILDYKEVYLKEVINGNSLNKDYLPKPFYEIIN